jgi:hypothetical protein
VYGVAQDEHKAAFLRELVNLAKDNPHPILIEGDFNILRFGQDKNNDRFDGYWPFLFNVVINSLNLREVSMTGRQYTWANNRPVPTYEKLDRILMDAEWETKYHMVSVHAMERIEKLSDHSPLLLDTNSDKLHGKKPSFKFELGWLSRDGFEDMVKEVWNRPVKGSSAILRWNNKIRALRKHLRGRARRDGIIKSVRYGNI